MAASRNGKYFRDGLPKKRRLNLLWLAAAAFEKTSVVQPGPARETPVFFSRAGATEIHLRPDSALRDRPPQAAGRRRGSPARCHSAANASSSGCFVSLPGRHCLRAWHESFGPASCFLLCLYRCDISAPWFQPLNSGSTAFPLKFARVSSRSCFFPWSNGWFSKRDTFGKSKLFRDNFSGSWPLWCNKVWFSSASFYLPPVVQMDTWASLPAVCQLLVVHELACACFASVVRSCHACRSSISMTLMRLRQCLFPFAEFVLLCAQHGGKEVCIFLVFFTIFAVFHLARLWFNFYIWE